MRLSKYTRISLPTESYLNLLGIAISVFSSNFTFLIENIIRNDNQDLYNWHALIDENKMSRIYDAINKTITPIQDDSIVEIFKEIIVRRNRIIHSFRVTSENKEQILATKNPKNQIQYEIDEEYLIDFINLNNKMSKKLHDLRGF